MTLGSPGMSWPVEIQLKSLFRMAMLYPSVKPVAIPLKINIMAKVIMNDGSFNKTIKEPFNRPDRRPKTMPSMIIHGPPLGNKKAAMMDDDDNMDPTERSILPIMIGNVSPAATKRNTVEMVNIPVIFLILEKGGIRIEKMIKTAAKSK